MKQFAILLFMCFFAVSCIDNEYDLSNVDASEESGMVIGNDQSEFKMPLATINFSVASFNQYDDGSEVSIMDLVDEVKIWLPSQLPGGVNYIEIEKLTNDSDYLSSILFALKDEMDESEQKRDEVCLLVAKQYRAELLYMMDGVLPQLVINRLESLSDEEAGALISTLYVTYNDFFSSAILLISADFLTDLEFEDIEIDIPDMDISEEIYSMLADNLDPSTVANPVNAIYLYGSIESQLPITLTAYPYLSGLTVNFGDIAISKGISPINDVRFYENDLHTLIYGGSKLVIPVVWERFYVDEEITEDQQVSINLKLRKTGGLKL